MSTATFHNTKRTLLRPYLDDRRPWLAGFNGGNHFDEEGEAARDPDDVP